MNDLQARLLEILKAYIEVCDKHHLRYFLISGTLLGAIRHGGFIPWDDDIDVAMPREDYEKFIKLQDEYKGTPYFIQTWKSDPHYIYGFAKLRDSSTTYIESEFVNHRINHGLWVDIFPIDGMSKDVKPREKFAWRENYVWWNVYMSYLGALIRKPKKETFFKDIGLNIVGGIFYLLDIAKWRNRWIDHWVKKKKIEDCALSGNHFGFNPKNEAMPSHIFLEYIKVKFENIEASIPKDYDTYLTLLYGDYMTPPPPDKQVGHHYNKGESLTIGYEEYLRTHKI